MNLMRPGYLLCVSHVGVGRLWLSLCRANMDPLPLVLKAQGKEVRATLSCSSSKILQLTVGPRRWAVYPYQSIACQSFVFRCFRVSHLLSALLVVVFGAALALGFGFEKNTEPQQSYPMPAHGVFKSSNPLVFTFDMEKSVQHQGKVLTYTPGNILEDVPVFIKLNGHDLGELPSCPSRWHLEQQVKLPKAYLVPGKNSIVFLAQGDAPSSWAIRNVYVSKESLKVASSFLELLKSAQKLYTERSVREGNLFRAQHLLRRANKNLPDQSDMLERFRKLSLRVDQALVQKLETALQQARYFIKVGKKSDAKHIYHSLLEEWVDPFDPLREKIIQEIQDGGMDLNEILHISSEGI